MRKLWRTFVTFIVLVAGIIAAPAAQTSVVAQPALLTTYTTPETIYSLELVGDQIWAVAQVDSKLHIMDKATGTIEQTVTLANTWTRSASYDANAVWYRHVAGAGAITKVDRTTYAVTTISVGGMPTSDVCTDGTYVWVTSTASNKIYQINASTNAWSDMKIDGDTFWVAPNGGGVVRQYSISDGSLVQQQVMHMTFLVHLQF